MKQPLLRKRGLCALLCLAMLAGMLAGCREEGTATPAGESGSAAESMSTGESEGQESSQSPAPELPEEEEPEEEPAVQWEWEQGLPENHGMDGELLAQLHSAVEGVDINAIVTVKDGVLIDEYYKEGYGKDTVFRLASCSKTFSGALIGVAIDKGYIAGVDAKLADFVPEFAESGDPYHEQITIEHLLTHSSGIEWYEWNGGSTFGELNRSDNWVEFIAGRQVTTEPGSVFAYTTGGSHLLAAVLQEATETTAFAFGEEHLFGPMGMTSVEWRADPQGVTDGGNGISMTARDAAQLGQLYLNGGVWEGEQIISREWVEQSVDVQFYRSGDSGSYGYQWWLRPFGGYDAYYAMGHGGQFIYVVPELELVTVMTSSLGSDTYAPWPYFTNYILAAYVGGEEEPG